MSIKIRKCPVCGEHSLNLIQIQFKILSHPAIVCVSCGHKWVMYDVMFPCRIDEIIEKWDETIRKCALIKKVKE